MMTKNSPKLAKIFICELCAYTCRKESDYKKHLLTRKHKNDDNELHENLLSKYTCTCGKIYKFRQGLSVHRKVCKNEVCKNKKI